MKSKHQRKKGVFILWNESLSRSWWSSLYWLQRLFFFPSIGFSNEFHVVIMMFLMKPVRIMKVKTDESTNKHSNLWVWALWATHQWDKQKIQRCQSHLAAVKLFLRALTSCRSEHWKGFLSQRRAACLTSHVESIISHSCSVSHLI